MISFAASAQSSVTLFGIIDEGFDFTNNVGGKKVYELQSGYVQGSRWGLSGAEDLGGGLAAVFKLENGFNLNNGKLGQGGLEFGRQAYVGISDKKFGSVTLGRQYDSVVDYLAPTTSNGNWAGYMFSHPYDNDNTDNSFRVNNTIKYARPSLYGLSFGGTYSFSNDSNFANKRQYSVGAQYLNGGIRVAAAYLQANGPSATSGGAIPSGGGNFVASRLRIWGIGANYTINALTAGVVYTHTDTTNPASSIYVGSILPASGSVNALKFDNFELNAKYQFTPAFYLGAMYTYTRATYQANGESLHPNYQSVGLMADYFLSKRTDLYLQGAYQHVGGDKTGSVLDVAYVPGAEGVASSNNQAVLRLAIRHKF